jgi:hypothetical protein
MVLTSYAANVFTTHATTTQDEASLQAEVDLTERAIRNAATRQKTTVLYNATTVGNPYSDPTTDTNLTALQISYRDAFITAGYLVSLDSLTGYWSLSWASHSIESNVAVYSIRTTVTPGAVSATTIQLIDCFFTDHTTAAYAASTSVQSGTGGDIQETDFGATLSTFYEYVTIVQQQTNATDLSASLLLELTTSPAGVGLGYTSSNVAVYKLV